MAPDGDSLNAYIISEYPKLKSMLSLLAALQILEGLAHPGLKLRTSSLFKPAMSFTNRFIFFDKEDKPKIEFC